MKHFKTLIFSEGWQQFIVETKIRKDLVLFRIGTDNSDLHLRKILDLSKLNRPKLFKTYLF